MALQLPAQWDPADVSAAMKGDTAGWQRLVTTWGPVVLRWCAWLGGPRVDHEDAAQQVFIIVFKKIDGLRDPERFPSWLFSITRRTLANARRKAWVRGWTDAPGAERLDPGPGTERRVYRSELTSLVEEALEMLSPKLREILILCHLEELTVPEAAEMAGIPLNTAKSRLNRARVRFREATTTMGLNPDDQPDSRPDEPDLALQRRRS